MEPPLGKKIGSSLYLHISALGQASSELVDLVQRGTTAASIASDAFNVVRFDPIDDALALLNYPAFFEEAFPSLHRSWKVRVLSGTVAFRTYADSMNPPILHRKELLLPVDDPRRLRFENLTAQLESLGLFEDPVRIGFKLQWERLLKERGFQVLDHDLVPIGNVEESECGSAISDLRVGVARHLTALARYGFSAPIQLLDRYGFLSGDMTVFDYGCGKGDDLRGLTANGITAEGWDPHYAADRPITPADIVNLGFVVNVIEDPVERRDALLRAYELAGTVLAVSVMIATEQAVQGRSFADGVLTSRNTFQKYYTQTELRDYLEATLGEQPVPVAPGVMFIFKNKDAEQNFQAARYRSQLRLRPVARPSPDRSRPSRVAQPRPPRPDKYEQYQPLLDTLWQRCLELGREPEDEEIPNLTEIEALIGSLRKAMRLTLSRHDPSQLEAAARQRAEDLRVYFALQHFQKRQPYRHLEGHLQRDVKAFFGSYSSARDDGRNLLLQAASPTNLREAAVQASEQGLGWLDPDASLQVHTSLISRLPGLLRAYVSCASVIYGDLENADLVKIHLGSGKVSLMSFDDFAGSPLPRMTRRVKINLRTQNVDVFEYGEEYAPPFLYLKSRFLNEESDRYAEQLSFDESLQALGLFDLSGYGPRPEEFQRRLHDAHWRIDGFTLERFHLVPDLDTLCGRTFTYRQLIECGETQNRLKLPNIPEEPSSFTALHDLATNVLDPVVEYFGLIELTYGFCSNELSRRIKGGIAPELDQHAAHERKRGGLPICARLGAAVDFLIRDEDMREVAIWIIANLPFDRLYFYGKARPIHVSFGPENRRNAYTLAETKSGRRVPQPWQSH